MRILSGLFLGGVSGFLIYFILAMAVGAKDIGSGFVAVTFLGGWAATSFLLLRGSKTTSKVWSRGALVGAAEWLAMIAATWLLAGHAFTKTVGAAGDTGGASVGAGIGAGIAGFLGTGISGFMVFVCLMTWFIASRMNKEMKSENDRAQVKCASCAEMIYAEAVKCKHCGHNIAKDSADKAKAA